MYINKSNKSNKHNYYKILVVSTFQNFKIMKNMIFVMNWVENLYFWVLRWAMDMKLKDLAI